MWPTFTGLGKTRRGGCTRQIWQLSEHNQSEGNAVDNGFSNAWAVTSPSKPPTFMPVMPYITHVGLDHFRQMLMSTCNQAPIEYASPFKQACYMIGLFTYTFCLCNNWLRLLSVSHQINHVQTTAVKILHTLKKKIFFLAFKLMNISIFYFYFFFKKKNNGNINKYMNK